MFPSVAASACEEKSREYPKTFIFFRKHALCFSQEPHLHGYMAQTRVIWSQVNTLFSLLSGSSLARLIDGPSSCQGLPLFLCLP